MRQRGQPNTGPYHTHSYKNRQPHMLTHTHTYTHTHTHLGSRTNRQGRRHEGVGPAAAGRHRKQAEGTPQVGLAKPRGVTPVECTRKERL